MDVHDKMGCTLLGKLNYSYTHNLSPTIENSDVKKVNYIEKGYNAKK